LLSIVLLFGRIATQYHRLAGNYIVAIVLVAFATQWLG
jgi:hypothetical protein